MSRANARPVKGGELAWQACDLVSPERELGQYLCVPPFRRGLPCSSEGKASSGGVPRQWGKTLDFWLLGWTAGILRDFAPMHRNRDCGHGVCRAAEHVRKTGVAPHAGFSHGVGTCRGGARSISNRDARLHLMARDTDRGRTGGLRNPSIEQRRGRLLEGATAGSSQGSPDDTYCVASTAQPVVHRRGLAVTPVPSPAHRPSGPAGRRP
jgi:hypothetical protein